MDPVLTVSGLCKRYPGFSLENVSFSLEKGILWVFSAETVPEKPQP